MEQTAFMSRRAHPQTDGGWEFAVRANDLAVGQQVRIALGPLSGLRGVVAGHSPDGKCVLEIAESARGILLCIRGHQLVPAD